MSNILHIKFEKFVHLFSTPFATVFMLTLANVLSSLNNTPGNFLCEHTPYIKKMYGGLSICLLGFGPAPITETNVTLKYQTLFAGYNYIIS